MASKGSPVQRRVAFAVILMQHSDAETIHDFLIIIFVLII